MVGGDDPSTNPVHMIAANNYRQIDPTIRSFLDRIEEAGSSLNSPDLSTFATCSPDVESYSLIAKGDVPQVNWRVVRPLGLFGEKYPYIFYLCRSQQDGVDAWATHGQAALRIAQSSQSVLIFTEVHFSADASEAVVGIREIFKTLQHHLDRYGLDPKRWAMIADGDISLVAVECLFVGAENPVSHPTSLALLTPAIGTRADDEMPYCLTCQNSAISETQFSPSLEYLRLLPPTLIVLAGVDPFRPSGEAFAQRLVLAEVETVSVCVLGAIHDFCWLAPLLDVPLSATALGLVTNAVLTGFTLENIP